MLLRPTTFILGAGASRDFKFPTGAELQDRISSLLSLKSNLEFASSPIHDALRNHRKQFDPNVSWQHYTIAAERIRTGMPVAGSIDNFLHTHSNDGNIVLLGKLAIAQAILDSEAALLKSIGTRGSDSSKFVSSQIYRNSWYQPFVKMLTPGTRSHNLDDLCANARFIVFNYDRCLELVLKHALISNYGCTLGEAYDALARIEIIHPYGSLGSIISGTADHVSFGSDEVDLLKVATRLQTFTESVESLTVEKARRLVAECDRLVFLGFGYLPQNIDLLAPTGQRMATKVHGTTKGISNPDKVVVKSQVKRLLRDHGIFHTIEIENYHGDQSNNICLDFDLELCTDLIQKRLFHLTS